MPGQTLQNYFQMATYDDILGKPGASVRRNPLQVSPPPIDTSMQGATTSVGSKLTERSMATDVAKPEGSKGLYTVTGFSGQPVVLGRDPEKGMDYVELYKAFNPNRPETEEERVKREKKEKREAIFASISDGISALSNLFFATQYAPNSYDPSKGMSARTRARWDKLRQEREANNRAYYDGLFRAYQLDDARNRDERVWQHTLEREKVSDERYEVKAAQEKALADLNEKLRQHQITEAEYKAEQERIAAQFAEETERLKQDNLRAGVRQKNAAAEASEASAAASYAKAEATKNGNSGSGSNKRTLRIGEETYTYGSSEDYDRAVEGYAKDFGVNLYIAYPDGKDKFKKTKWTTKRKPTSQIAAEVEARAAEISKSKIDNNTMPGVGGGDSSNKMPGVK